MSDRQTGSSATYPSDVAFTPAVKAVQTRKGSRDAYARVEQNGGWQTEIDAALEAFIGEQTSFFLATANAEGQRIAAGLRASSKSSTSRHWRSRIFAATGNTSRKAISPRIRGRIFS